ncbi:hypothetical protein AVEN_208330-1 [Araneus ventricosus]|uniref:Integrase p58-like C-terminal domain-containing protein n=1 Tax=Araneus ventricosus TaxID=182803 RepID=A0A4Y2NZG4_ARAVE|nr:hypothetical protein AVEN_208330-1 [Araneus ventricosus]
MYSRDPVIPYDLIFSDSVRLYSDTPTYAHQLVNRLQSSFALLKQHVENSAEEFCKKPVSLPKSKQIAVGDLVYLHIPKIKIHNTKKLAKFNQGPFRLIKQFSPDIFEIQQVNQRSKKQKVHLNRLIKLVERDTFPNTQVGESPIPEIESVIDSLVTPSEEEILQL